MANRNYFQALQQSLLFWMFCSIDLAKFNRRKPGLNTFLTLTYRNNKRDGFYPKWYRVHHFNTTTRCLYHNPFCHRTNWQLSERQVYTPSLKPGQSKPAIRYHGSFRGWVWEIHRLYPFTNPLFLCEDRSHQVVILSSFHRFLLT